MSHIIDPHAIELVQIDVANLRRLAASQPVDFGTMRVPAGSLPPPKVVTRALAGLGAGTPALWCVPFLIVPSARDVLFGSCGFKGAPQNRTAEISYALAPSHRRRGIATAAVGQLLEIAAASGIVDEVLAHIIQGNTASENLAHRLGFQRGRMFMDLDGADVVKWTWQVRSGEE